MEKLVDCNMMEVDPNITYVIKIIEEDGYLLEDDCTLCDIDDENISVFRGAELGYIAPFLGKKCEIIPFCEIF